METTDDTMFSPPDSGYGKEIIHESRWKRFTIPVLKSDPAKFQFYFRTASGKYAAVRAEITRFSPECEVFIYASSAKSMGELAVWQGL